MDGGQAETMETLDEPQGNAVARRKTDTAKEWVLEGMGTFFGKAMKNTVCFIEADGVFVRSGHRTQTV